MIYRYFSYKKAKNILANRFRYLFQKRNGNPKGMPISLSFEVSSICQLRCPECVLGRMELQRKNKLMDFELFKKNIDEAASYLTYAILYFQGEPFLAPQIFDMIAYADEKRIFTQTSTNAQAIDENCAEKIVKSGLQRLIISLDGISQENYSKYRIGGDINKTIEAIKLINHFKKTLHKKTPKIELQMLVFRHNEEEIPAFKTLAKKLSVYKATLKTAQIYDINQGDKAELLPKNKRYSRYIYKKGLWRLKKPIKNQCLRLWQSAVITSDGLMFPCCFDKNGDHSYGNTHDASIQQLWNGEISQNFRKQVYSQRSAIGICRNCTE
jgi:Predicted Fe-S oxidoreductases